MRRQPPSERTAADPCTEHPPRRGQAPHGPAPRRISRPLAPIASSPPTGLAGGIDLRARDAFLEDDAGAECVGAAGRRAISRTPLGPGRVVGCERAIRYAVSVRVVLEADHAAPRCLEHPPPAVLPSLIGAKTDLQDAGRGGLGHG